ncbi:MAG TPA: PQQ-binding-like beta-propeller repeat protein [Gaiellaceae bacterium]|nr:PQQ-binding-like beta-propeller repeat protein [Gaiellaceae bacterium]
MSRNRFLVVAAAALALPFGLWAGSASGRAATGGNDWTRFGWSPSRSSAPTFPTGITAANVKTLTRQQVQLDGTVDSSAIYLHGVQVNGGTHDVFFVTTTYGKTEAVDAASGAVLWRFTPPGYSSWAGSPQITTATPVADPGRTSIYAATPGGQIVKLAVADGRALWSVTITKLPSREKIAASLNFASGHVIATTGGYYGDAPPYQGHVAVIDAAHGRLLHVWNSLCSNRHALIAPPSCPSSDSAIWGRSGAVIDPANGDLLVATGNGPWDGRTNWGDATLRLTPGATTLLGNYTPSNTAQLSSSDADLGSTSPVILSAGYLAQGGKDGKIRVLSVAKMRGAAAHRGGELQTVPTPSGTDLFTAPAVWHSSSTWLFAGDNGGTAGYIFKNGRLRVAWRNGTGGTSPVVAGGLLWVYGPGGGLAVYRPTTGALVTRLDAGAGHWNSPIVVDGRVALPEGNANDHATSGVLDIWRLP